MLTPLNLPPLPYRPAPIAVIYKAGNHSWERAQEVARRLSYRHWTRYTVIVQRENYLILPNRRPHLRSDG